MSVYSFIRRLSTRGSNRFGRAGLGETGETR